MDHHDLLVRPVICKMESLVVVVIHYLLRCSPTGSAVQNHDRAYPAPYDRPRCVGSGLRAHVQFCRFDKADATADVQ